MKKKILVIEDEEIIAQMIKDNLEARGYSAMIANSGLEGLQKAESFSPHLILLDIMMPKMDGINVLKRLKANTITEKIPVIIISIADSYQEEGLRFGAAAFVKKPFDFDLLTEKITDFTNKKYVMVVDDNRETLSLIKMRLEMLEYKVVCAEDEESVFEKLDIRKPDIILMDIVLSRGDGLEITRKLKGMEKYSDIPIIAFSGYVSDELSGKEITGVDRYISGEFNIKNIIDEVKKHIEKS